MRPPPPPWTLRGSLRGTQRRRPPCLPLPPSWPAPRRSPRPPPPRSYLAELLAGINTGAAPAGGAVTATLVQAVATNTGPPGQQVVSGGARGRPSGPVGRHGGTCHRQPECERRAASWLRRHVHFGGRERRRRYADVEPTGTGGHQPRRRGGWEGEVVKGGVGRVAPAWW